MADQARWFKFWYSALSDDHLQRLPPSLRWAWVALGAYTKTHGTRGRVALTEENGALCSYMGIALGTLKACVTTLPHLHVEEGKTDNGEFTVTWDNWSKYQEDSTVYERVKRLRSKRRGEENRTEEKRTTPQTPLQGGSVVAPAPPPGRNTRGGCAWCGWDYKHAPSCNRPQAET